MDGYRDSQARVRPWWREIQVLWLLLLVGGIYFSRISDLNLQGEETRRAQVAREMVWSGNWIVPEQQGKLYLSRPPLGNWLIAVAAQVRGEFDAVAVRLPSLLAILLTTLLIYGYSRNYLTQTGAFIAAVSYPTMLQVLQLGRLAESESLFTLFLSGALLVWHGGHLQGWPAWKTWVLGYFLAALAGLTKGPQGLIYFVGPVWFYLLFLERKAQMLLRPAHFLGMIAGAATIAVWQIPFVLATSGEAGQAIWLTQAANRYAFSDPWITIKHLVQFPLEVLACTLPWSLAFLQLLNRNFWRSIPGIRPQVGFLLSALMVTFPTLWFAPQARGRYFMSLYPVLAVLCGVILERCALANPSTAMNRGWRQFVLGLSGAGVVGGIVACAIALGNDLGLGSIYFPQLMAGCFLAIALGAMAWMIWKYRSQAPRDIQTAAAGLAMLFGLAYAGPVVSSLIARQPKVDQLLSEVREQLPGDEILVSFGRVTHAFAYYYGEFIPQEPWPDGGQEDLPQYFCCRKRDLEFHPLPFAWEAIAEMSFEDDKNPSSGSYVLIARRLPTVAAKPSIERR